MFENEAAEAALFQRSVGSSNYPSRRRGAGVACKQTTSEITRLAEDVTASVARIWEPISAARSFITKGETKTCISTERLLATQASLYYEGSTFGAVSQTFYLADTLKSPPEITLRNCIHIA